LLVRGGLLAGGTLAVKGWRIVVWRTTAMDSGEYGAAAAEPWSGGSSRFARGSNWPPGTPG
jgi:hypothetical protein